jgi:NTP pyrophosphatase (non-canonical NTP hydrolase)
MADLDSLAFRCRINPELVNKEITFWSTCLAGEVGELCNVIKKREHPGKHATDKQLEEEIAGVFIYFILLTRRLGYNLLNLHEIIEIELQKVMTKRLRRGGHLSPNP